MQNRNAFFDDILKKYDRVAVTGAPKTAKTTQSRRVKDRPVVGSDEIQPDKADWSEASQMLADRVNAIKGKVFVEGVTVPRAIRKGMRVDVVVLLREPVIKQKPGHVAMGKGVMTVLDEISKKFPGLPIFTAPPPPPNYTEEEDDEESDQE